jgi:hypothetical protein
MGKVGRSVTAGAPWVVYPTVIATKVLLLAGRAAVGSTFARLGATCKMIQARLAPELSFSGPPPTKEANVTKILALTALILTILVLAIPVGPVRAHAICTDSGCCSPHGQNVSSAGCTFAFCSYDGSSTWARSFACNRYVSAKGCAVTNCEQTQGTANALANHSVNVTDCWSFCEVYGSACEAPCDN